MSYFWIKRQHRTSRNTLSNKINLQTVQIDTPVKITTMIEKSFENTTTQIPFSKRNPTLVNLNFSIFPYRSPSGKKINLKLGTTSAGYHNLSIKYLLCSVSGVCVCVFDAYSRRRWCALPYFQDWQTQSDKFSKLFATRWRLHRNRTNMYGGGESIGFFRESVSLNIWTWYFSPRMCLCV